MDIRGFLTCITMWLCSVDGYNTINHFRLWLQCHWMSKGASIMSMRCWSDYDEDDDESKDTAGILSSGSFIDD